MKIKEIFICLVAICVTLIIANWSYNALYFLADKFVYPPEFDITFSRRRPIGIALIFCVTYALIKDVLSNNDK